MSYDFSKITERLFVGAQVNADVDVATMKMASITHVIDAQDERDDRLVPAMSSMVYLWDPTADDGVHPKPVRWFAAAVEFAAAALARPGTVLLAHCGAGRNRGPSLAYAILRAQGWPSEDALALLRAKRSVVTLAYWQDAEPALRTLGWVR